MNITLSAIEPPPLIDSIAGSEPDSYVIDAASALVIPDYLQQIYWWAYIHPNAVRAFEREWLVNLILFGNYSRLCDAALSEFNKAVACRNLQVACVYGDLTERLSTHVSKASTLDIVDVLPIQLANLRRKLSGNSNVSLLPRDSTALGFADASYDRVLLFFLLHEQPEEVRRKTLSEAFRTVKSGGKIVIVDYHGPSHWHPLRLPMLAILGALEPYALDLWRNDIANYFPDEIKPAHVSKQTYFGGLYQKLVLTR
jgi:ubiquinone/menaquinone biosynthesis C-methylase UbiE